MAAQHHIAGFDHTVILLKDLEAARAAYEKLGFRVSQRNAHPTTSTANHLIVFRRDYMELLTVVEETPANVQMAQVLQHGGDGLRMLSLATDNSDAVKANLSAASVETFGPFTFGRKMKLPNGQDAEALFTVTVPHPAGSLFEALVFTCEHKTPQYAYEADGPPHPNGATGLRFVEVPVADVAATAKRMEILAGRDALAEKDGVLTLTTPTIPIRFIPQAGWDNGKASAKIGIAVTNFAETKAWFSKNGVVVETAKDTINVPASQACTAVLEFGS